MSAATQKEDFEGLTYAEPAFDPAATKTAAFIALFKARFVTDQLPFGIRTAEAYDSVLLMASLIAAKGELPEKLKPALYGVHDFVGASGKVSIDGNGDGVRKYELKQVTNGNSQKIGPG